MTHLSALRKCLFCDQDMPVVRTQRLLDDAQTLLDRFHNYGADSILSTATIGFCLRHEDESTHVPKGIAEAWPTVLDTEELVQRIRTPRHWAVLRRVIERPQQSEYFRAILVRVEKQGKAALSLASQMQNMAELRPGYYGERGWEFLLKFLLSTFSGIGRASKTDETLNLSSDERTAAIKPLTPTLFVTVVLMPELLTSLFIEDLERAGKPHTAADAKRLRQESTRYGAALFPTDGDGINIVDFVRRQKRHQNEQAAKKRAVDSFSLSSGSSESATPTPAHVSQKKSSFLDELDDLANA